MKEFKLEGVLVNKGCIPGQFQELFQMERHVFLKLCQTFRDDYY